jgi:hypothetical protein
MGKNDSVQFHVYLKKKTNTTKFPSLFFHLLLLSKMTFKNLPWYTNSQEKILSKPEARLFNYTQTLKLSKSRSSETLHLTVTQKLIAPRINLVSTPPTRVSLMQGKSCEELCS